jgi:hypothetical protein
MPFKGSRRDPIQPTLFRVMAVAVTVATGAVAISGTSSTTFTPAVVAQIAISGTSTTTFAGQVVGSDAISGTSTIDYSSGAIPAVVGATPLAGTSDLVVSPPSVVGASALEGDSVLSAAGQVIGGTSIAGEADFAVNSEQELAQVNFGGTSTFGASDSGHETGTANGAGTSAFAAQGMVVGAVAFAGQSAVSGASVVASAVAIAGQATLAEAGQVAASTALGGTATITAEFLHATDVGAADLGGSSDLLLSAELPKEWFPATWPPITLDSPDDFARAENYATKATGPQEFADRLGGRSRVIGKRNKRNPFR